MNMPHIPSPEAENEKASNAELDEIERKSLEMQARIYEAGHVQMPDSPDWSYKRNQKSKILQSGSNYAGLGIGMTISYLLVGAMVVGFGGGYAVDYFLHTKMLFTAIFGFSGMGIGLFGAIFLISRNNQEENRKK